jgi:threonine dehydrogenase-like Zn-dependent dehydrogenase
MTAARYPETVEASALVARPGGQFAVEPLLVPGPGRDNIVVQIAYSGVSVGTESGALSGTIDWGGFPAVTGYMATGTVSMVGSAVTGFAPGDRVYVRHNEGLRLAQSVEADFVFEATGKASLIDLGIALTRPFGTLIWQGHYGEGPVEFEFVRVHHKQLRMLFPCDDGLAECRAALLRSVQDGLLPVELLITDRLSPANAAGFFAGLPERQRAPAIADHRMGVIA